ncbi:fb0fcae3-ff52-42bf-9e7d-9158462c7b61 [Thermothielavioides terrestris]|uniref:Pyridoxamine 5'-phosphate oxidase N-terminal domain-containing protein n=2 Tax=Thermothielavioides terrestris TaxID=2587410 RepID=G2R0F9_THETT|nr:uncharacterized protein THITE_2112772 [Thermothielavioides terrestris NRRL 8126]AEO65624.1 hypothetical protein THITE_2112772 [Thermothielavioides terrestris NRRL 8126]SPQ19119.1 fb0fcae3-ff52-42bf-9e7d-9158462c7b61 [Thermothielavioides terrestris]
MEQQIPLSHEASAGDTNMRVTTSLPPEVVQCLENARFLHLATCSDNIPHVSLMNYTYLPSSRYSRSPVIIMTTNPASKKMNNLEANPNVSLLVHDWVSHRPTPTSQARRLSSSSSSDNQPPLPHREPPSSLAALLFNLNTSAVSSISATINGSARLAPRGSAEERYYRDVHLANNTFDTAPPGLTGGAGGDGVGADGGAAENGGSAGRSRFAAGDDEVRVIVVGIRDVRIADWKGAVRDWVIAAPGEDEQGSTPMVNGVA